MNKLKRTKTIYSFRSWSISISALESYWLTRPHLHNRPSPRGHRWRNILDLFRRAKGNKLFRPFIFIANKKKILKKLKPLHSGVQKKGLLD